MTETGRAIISEFATEIREHIEDDKNQIRIEQGISNVGTAWRWFLYGVNAYVASFLVVFMVCLAFIDPDSIEVIRTASAQELQDGLHNFFYIVTIVWSLMYFVSTVFVARRFYRDKKREREEDDRWAENLTARIIEVGEELLYRHGLINKAEGSDHE